LTASAAGPAAAAGYLFAFSGFGYWSQLTGAGEAYSAAMRADRADGAVHKQTGEPWPEDVDVYQDNPDCRLAVLEYRDGAYRDSALLSWPQQWLYILYPQVLAVSRTWRRPRRSAIACRSGSTAIPSPGLTVSARVA
jgi:hypothetical protein